MKLFASKRVSGAQRPQEASVPSPTFLPPFPVIDVVLDEEGMHASAQGTESYHQQLHAFVSELDAQQLNAYGADLVRQVLEELRLDDDVRVLLHDAQGSQHPMWYSSDSQSLYPFTVPSGSKAGRTVGAQVFSTGGGFFASLPGLRALPAERRALLLIALGLVLAVALTFGGRSVLGSFGSSEEPELPQAAQLPVTAPAGWDTYADYAVEASVVDPVVYQQEIIYAYEGQLRYILADTGEQTGSTEAGFKISEIYEVSGLSKGTIAVAGSGSQAAIGRIGDAELNVIEPPEETTTLEWISGLPVYVGTGFIWVPDENGQLKRYTAPADSKPAVVDGASVWMVSSKEPKAWHISSDAAQLPEAVEIPAVEGYTYKGLVAGVNHHIVLAWSTEDLSGTRLEILEATGEHRLENARVVAGTASEYNTVTDSGRNLLLSAGTFVNVETNQAMKVSSSAKYGAGFAWVTGIESQRVSVDGEIVSWSGTANSVIPAAIDGAGRAVVVYKPSNSSEPLGKLYVLTKAHS